MFIALIGGINISIIAAYGLVGEISVFWTLFSGINFHYLETGHIFLSVLSVQPCVVVRIYPLKPKEKQSCRTASEGLQQTQFRPTTGLNSPPEKLFDTLAFSQKEIFLLLVFNQKQSHHLVREQKGMCYLQLPSSKCYH